MFFSQVDYLVGGSPVTDIDDNRAERWSTEFVQAENTSQRRVDLGSDRTVLPERVLDRVGETRDTATAWRDRCGYNLLDVNQVRR